MPNVFKWFRFALIAIAVIGGLLGFAFVVAEFVGPEVHGILSSFLLLVLAAAYAYVFVSGMVFWKQPQQLRPIFWAFAIQIPWISIPGIVYKFAASYWCVAFVIKHTQDTYSAGVTTNFGLGPFCEIRFFQNAPIEVEVNVVALAALLFIIGLKRTKFDNVPTSPDPIQTPRPEMLQE